MLQRPRIWDGTALIALAIMSAIALAMLGTGLIVGGEGKQLVWPESAHARIEWMASTIRWKRRPTTWCSPSNNPENVYEFDRDEEQQDIGTCLSAIAPVSGFQETMPGYYVRRFYRAEVGDKFCEVTLSTVSEERLVGHDCYFGLFPKAKDTGIGMTNDKFG